MAQKLMISIIDDDDAVREATGDLIRSLGYAAATFASAEDYLQSDCAKETSCIISDMRLPGMTGVELQEWLAHSHKTPIIFMTAFPEEKMRIRVLKTGAFGFLRKPFNDDCLVECLNKALAS